MLTRPIHHPRKVPRLFTSFATALILGSGGAMADTSSALSKATVVDTRDLLPVTPVATPLVVNQVDGRTLVHRASARTTVKRRPSQAAIFEVNVPKFAAKGGGWGRYQSGLGAFHGMEMLYSGSPGDRLDHLAGGPPPSTTTPAKAWRPMASQQVLDRLLTPGRHYFRIRFDASSSPDPVFSIRFHSARFCSAAGKAVTSLDPAKPLWLLFHDTDSSEETLRVLHPALQKATRGAQVVSVDWASAAAGTPPWKNPTPSGDYLANLGHNVAHALKQAGIPRSRIHLLGHGCGSLAAYETARQLGGVGHFIALDPSPDPAGAYPTTGTHFSKVSRVATSVIGGPPGDATLGDDLLASRSDFSIRLVSTTHAGAAADAIFHHQLPVDWCARTLADPATPYWPFFRKDILLRPQATPKLPWGAYRKLAGNLDLECHGATRYPSGSSEAFFETVRFLVFRKPGGTLTEARATTSAGTTTWKYSKH